MRPHAARASMSSTAEQASKRVLGIGFQNPGIGAAKAWGLPESLQHTMRMPEGAAPIRRVERTAERLSWVARAANEVAEIVLSSDPQSLEIRLGRSEQRCVARRRFWAVAIYRVRPMGRATFRLSCANRGLSVGMAIVDRETSLLRTPRNQAVMAFRAAG
jgi:hypothetical protein